ncbi:MAG: hypothetical protein JRI68_35400, partial [Deltaproteobacteria bacterium]|nr:hypothetical protein [Deltaproteobacteria bacterium]
MVARWIGVWLASGLVLAGIGCDGEETTGGTAGSGATAVGGAAGSGGTGGSAGSGGSATGGGGSSAAPCSAADPDRIFFNDFEDGTYVAGSGETPDPSRHFVFRANYSDETHFAVVDDTATPDTRLGTRVLRGNFWEFEDPNASNPVPAVDPAAAAGGVTIYGNKRPGLSVALSELGIPQMPPDDPNAPIDERGELYVSFWLWYDADFTHESTMGNQGVKLFYAFGPNHVEWVLSEWDSTTLHMHHNINNVSGAWPELGWLTGFDSFNGRWSHIEWYFLEESAPLYYEYGSFSNPSNGYLASDCPGVDDYTMQFPVPGSSPQQCLTPAEAYGQN